MDEFVKLLDEHPFFYKMKMYMENSFVMNGDHTKTKDSSFESEAHIISGGMVNPMQ